LRSATALLFPSRYEGFGIPSLEAMVHGCPVIASTAAGLREVCGDAALHFHPDDAITLRGLMQTVLDDPEVAEAMRSRGLGRPDMYQWDAAAAALIEGIQNLEHIVDRRKFVVAKRTYQKDVPLR
jgi:glycosyltransferase involved in cell wall biosynthesis